jgi:hypothetical protein
MLAVHDYTVQNLELLPFRAKGRSFPPDLIDGLSGRFHDMLLLRQLHPNA